jgi:hypothetical protein
VRGEIVAGLVLLVGAFLWFALMDPRFTLYAFGIPSDLVGLVMVVGAVALIILGVARRKAEP